MFNLFYTLFKYKEKAQKDELGYYPEKVDVRAFPERRYLWTSRFFVVISCLSLCFTMFLSAILIIMIPMKKTKMMPLQIDYERYKVSIMQSHQSVAFASNLVTESILESYITQRYTIGESIEELKHRLGKDEFINLASNGEVYEEMVNLELPYFEALQRMGIRRKVICTRIYPVSYDFWQVRFSIIESGPNMPKPKTTYWIATLRMTFKMAAYDNKEQGLKNPFGITVLMYDLSYMGDDVKSRKR